MRRGVPSPASALASMLAVGLLAGGCARPAPDAPAWQPPAPAPPLAGLARRDTGDMVRMATARAAPGEGNRLVAGHVYDLTELIDLAEATSPRTRGAWNRARNAAQGIGLARALYLPHLALSVMAGYQTAAVPLPAYLTAGQGWFTLQTAEIIPMLTVNWLLFDFGKRDAEMEVARQLAFASDAGFTGEHQRLMFDVCRTYFQLSAARERTRAAGQAVADATIVETAARARQGQGIATSIEVAQAVQATAQARFALVGAQGQESTAYTDLLHAAGLPYDTMIAVRDAADRPLPSGVDQNLDRLVQKAVVMRPDVQASLASVRASQARVRSAQADFRPRIFMTGNVAGNIGWFSARLHGNAANALAAQGLSPSVPDYTMSQPMAGVMMGLSVPLYDGGMRRSQLASARAQADSAAADLEQMRQNAAQEVVGSYNALRTGLAAFRAAEALLRAATVTHDAALDVYRHGLGTMQDVAMATTGLETARQDRADSHAAALTAAAALAFATGALGSASAAPMAPDPAP
ncbi:TolC family protein [Gluconacetobacter johannae]|uniref:Protein CyaE n=1 Tax=Gluconacetobacter johannae TaxID=112140 RepID=A0A7W4J5N8_9PROT|nr:TolC family protein [Gluconacetobacter johannae]MBB2175101.1 TolC family protein [Gluconacetobacter johannae]